MKKLLVVLFVTTLGLRTYCSVKDTYKQALYDLLGKGESALIVDRFRSSNVLRVRQYLLPAPNELLPKINELCGPTNGQSSWNIMFPRDDYHYMQDLYEYSKRFPELLPFLKKAYGNCLKLHDQQETNFRLYRKGSPFFPKKEVIDAYPSSYKAGTAEAIVLGPLLNPGSITKEEYEKQLKRYSLVIFKYLKFFLVHKSEVLFPGLLKTLRRNTHDIFPDNAIKGKFMALIDDLENECDDEDYFSAAVFAMPDEKRDLAVLKAFWKTSIDDPGLLPFVEKGHANFKKCYGHSAPVRSLKLKEGLTLGMYADKNKDSDTAKLCRKLDPASTSFFVKAVVVGIFSGMCYFAYKKYKSYRSSRLSGGVDLSSVKV